MSEAPALTLSEKRRQAALASWEATGPDPEARRRRTEPSRQVRQAGRVGQPHRRTLKQEVGDLRAAIQELAQLIGELRRAS